MGVGVGVGVHMTNYDVIQILIKVGNKPCTKSRSLNLLGSSRLNLELQSSYEWLPYVNSHYIIICNAVFGGYLAHSVLARTSSVLCNGLCYSHPDCGPPGNIKPYMVECLHNIAIVFCFFLWEEGGSYLKISCGQILCFRRLLEN